MRTKAVVVVGFLGSVLDEGKTVARWERWRPTVALCQHEELIVARLELLHDPAHAPLLRRVAGDIAQVSPETEVVPRPLAIANPWDFEAMYGALHDFARAYAWR